MKVFINIELGEKEREWTAQNGAKRRTLVLVNKGNFEGSLVKADIGYLDKGRHSFIFLNREKQPSEKIVGIFLNRTYGYTIVSDHSPEGAVLYGNYSVGGYGNSCSQFGIYKLGTVLAEHSYKNRKGERYWKLTEKGWEFLGEDIPLEESEISFLK